MSFRYTVVFTVRSNDESAASRMTFMFSITSSVWRAMSSSITWPVFGSRAVMPATKTNPLALIACEKGPTGFGARSVEIARSFVPVAEDLLSALLATPGATAAASPLAAAFRKNVLRFMSFPSSTQFQISNLLLQPDVTLAIHSHQDRIGKPEHRCYFLTYLLKFRGPTSAPYTLPASSAATPSAAVPFVGSNPWPGFRTGSGMKPVTLPSVTLPI